MTKQTEAMKAALTALKSIDEAMPFPVAKFAIRQLEEALAQQETVLPGGGHVPAVPVAVYGYCPECGGAGVMRERRPNGDDKCTNGHKYPSSKALAEQPAPATELREQEPVAWMWTHTKIGKVGVYFENPAQFYDLSKPSDYEWAALYTSPPANANAGKPWVGLTQEDWMELKCKTHGEVRIGLDVAAKLLEKNT